MIGAIKLFLRTIMAPCLYTGGIGIILASIFKNAKYGFFLLIFLIPQPNIWYKFFAYPYGKDFMDLLILSIFVGVVYQRKAFFKSKNNFIIITLIMFTYFALWNSYLRFGLKVPLTTGSAHFVEFKNYVEMILLYFLSFSLTEDNENAKKIIIIITIVILLISVRSFRNFSGGSSFSYDKRVGGPFWRVGLTANHAAAFIVDYTIIAFCLSFFTKNIKEKIFYLTTSVFSLHPLFFSYSRGAYLATLCAVAFIGMIKKRSLLIGLIVLVAFWQVILPPSVVDRISMTQTEDGEIEHSAGGRLDLWMLAFDLYLQSPIIGSGFGAYTISFGQTEMNGETLPKNQDVHNFFMRTLCEQGIIGFGILLAVLFKAFLSGRYLYKKSKDEYTKGFGLAFMASVIAVTVTNIFGDRWSYFVVGSYFWIFWGITDRLIINMNRYSEDSV